MQQTAEAVRKRLEENGSVDRIRARMRNDKVWKCCTGRAGVMPIFPEVELRAMGVPTERELKLRAWFPERLVNREMKIGALSDAIEAVAGS